MNIQPSIEIFEIHWRCFKNVDLLGIQHQDRRHMPLSNPNERRHNQSFHNNNDRRHINTLSDRRHISPPLHINICENPTAILNSAPNDGIHQRNIMEYSHPHRRHGRGKSWHLLVFSGKFLVFIYLLFIYQVIGVSATILFFIHSHCSAEVEYLYTV